MLNTLIGITIVLILTLILSFLVAIHDVTDGTSTATLCIIISIIWLGWIIGKFLL